MTIRVLSGVLEDDRSKEGHFCTNPRWWKWRSLHPMLCSQCGGLTVLQNAQTLLIRELESRGAETAVSVARYEKIRRELASAGRPPTPKDAKRWADEILET